MVLHVPAEKFVVLLKLALGMPCVQFKVVWPEACVTTSPPHTLLVCRKLHVYQFRPEQVWPTVHWGGTMVLAN